MEKYLEKQRQIDDLKSNLFEKGLLLSSRVKKLYNLNKINENQYKNADLILSLTTYNLGCCSKRYTITGLQKIAKRFEKYDSELLTLEK